MPSSSSIKENVLLDYYAISIIIPKMVSKQQYYRLSQ